VRLISVGVNQYHDSGRQGFWVNVDGSVNDAIGIAQAFQRHSTLQQENTSLSLAKMLSGANAFEISDIQEDETQAPLTSRIRM
jgi:hypothetical protein